ncbi:MAG TPA: outer membrane beta-barrel protein [Brumimicrobium sp.]|nr:outer membrane beta-barrel protein [Brumimicrobium sp.]
MSIDKKVIIILLVSFFSQFSFGQKYSVHKKRMSYLAFNAGFNFSFPKVSDRYSVLNSLEENYEKKYDKAGKNTGAQFGIRYSYNFTNSIALNLGFGYQSLGFKYFTDYSWNDTINNQDFNREMHHLQKISYFSFPMMVRWDMSNRQLIPYLQGGVFMDFRHQAKKEIHYDNTIDGKETKNEVSSSEIKSITDQTRKFNMGLMAGAGISYYTKHFTFGVEGNFRYGFFKIVNDENRYSDLTGFALQYLDVLDQLKLSNLNIQFTVSIPINHSVTMNILRRSKYYK